MRLLYCCVLLLMLIVVVYGQRQLSNTSEKHGATQTKSNSSRGKTRFTQTQEYQESRLDSRPTKSKTNHNRSPAKSETRIVENFTPKPFTTSRGRTQDNRRTIYVTTVKTPPSIKTAEKNYEVEEVLDDIPREVADQYHYSRASAEKAAQNEALLSAQRVQQQSRSRKQNYQETIDNALQSTKTVSATTVQRQSKPRVVTNDIRKGRTNTKSRNNVVIKAVPRIDQSYSRVTEVSQTIKPDSETRVIEVTENEPDISYTEFLLRNTNKPKPVTSNKRPSTFDDSNFHYRTGRKIQSIIEPVREVRVVQRSNSRHSTTTQSTKESTMPDLRTPKGRGNKKASLDFNERKRSKSLDSESVNIATSRGRGRLSITDLPQYVSYMKRVEPVPPKPQTASRRVDTENETFDNVFDATQEIQSGNIILPLMNMELKKTDFRTNLETAASRRTETKVPVESTQPEATYTVRSRNIRSTTEKLNELRNEVSSRRGRGRTVPPRTSEETKQNVAKEDVIPTRGSSGRRSNDERRLHSSRSQSTRSGRRNSEAVEQSTFTSRGSRRSNARNDASTTSRSANRRSSKSYDTPESSPVHNNYPDKMPSHMRVTPESSTDKPSSTTPLSDNAATALNISKTEQVTAVDKSYPSDNKVTPTKSLELMDQEPSEKVMTIITPQPTVASRGRQRSSSTTTASSAPRRSLSRRGRENDRTLSSTASTTLTDAPKSLRRGSVKATESTNLKRETINRGRGSVKAKINKTNKASDDEDEAEESDNYPEPFKALLKKKKLVDEDVDGSRPSTSSTITSRTRDEQLIRTRVGSEKVVNTIKVSSSTSTTTTTTTPTPSSKSSRVKLTSSSSGNRYRGRGFTSPKTVSSTSSTTESIVNEISDDQFFATLEKATTVASIRSRPENNIKTRRPIANRFVKPSTTEKPIIEKQNNFIQRNKPTRNTKKTTDELDNNVVPLTNLVDSTTNSKYTTPNFNNARQISPTPESTEGTTLSQNVQKKTRNFVPKAKGFQPSKQVITNSDNQTPAISGYKKKAQGPKSYRNTYTTQIPQVVAKPSDHKFSARYRSELIRASNFRVTSTPSYTPTVPVINTSHRNAKNDININDNETDLEILTVIPSNIPKLYSDNLVLDDNATSTTTTESYIQTTEKVTIITPESTSNIATLLTVTTTDNPTEKPTTGKPLTTTTQVPKTTTTKKTPVPFTTSTIRTTPKYATINRLTTTTSTLATPTTEKKVEVKRQEAKITSTTQTTPTTIIKQSTPTYTTTVKNLITEKIYTAESAPPNNFLTTLLSNYINNPTVTTKFPETTRSYSTVSEIKSIDIDTTTQLSSTENASTKENVAQQQIKITKKSIESENLVVKNNVTPSPKSITSTTLSTPSIIAALRTILQNNFPRASRTSLSISNLSLLPNISPPTTTIESETQAQFSLDTASSESSTNSILIESTTMTSTSSISPTITTAKPTTTPISLTTPQITTVKPSTTSKPTTTPKTTSPIPTTSSTTLSTTTSTTPIPTTTAQTTSPIPTTSSTTTTTETSVTTTALPSTLESFTSATTLTPFTSPAFLTTSSLPSSTSKKPHTAYPTAWAPPGYVPRFATRPSIALLGTMSSTTNAPTKSQNDYYVFGILPNNTVVRKKPRLLTATTSSPFIVFGIFPNNTIVRKYPNGTIVPDDDSSDVEITNLSANNLKYSLQTGINITTTSSSEATNNIMITTTPASTSTTTITTIVNTLLNQEDNIQDNLIDNTVRKISPASFTNPEASASTHILSLTTTKAPRTTESLEVKSTTIPSFTPLDPKLPTLAEILGPKVVEAYKEILNETRANRTTNEIDTPISVFDINQMEKTLKDNPEFKITTIRPVTVNWMPIQGVPFTAVPASAYYNATSSSTTSSTSTSTTTTTSKSQMIDFIQKNSPQSFVPTTTLSSTSQTTEQFLSTKSEITKPSTTTVRHTTPRPTRTRHKTTTTTPKPTTEKPTPSTRRTTTTQRRPAKVPVTTIKVIETTMVPTTLKTVSTTAKVKKTTQLPVKEQSIQDELAFLNSLREASSVITQKPSKEQEDLASRIISLAIGNQNKPTTSTTKPQESSLFNLLEVPSSPSTTTSRTPKNIKANNNNNKITADEIKTFQEDLQFLKLLQDSGLAGSLGSLGSVTKAPVISTTYGKSNEALLAALLKEQGIGPAVPQNNQLLQDLQLAALLDQIVTPSPKPKPRPKPKPKRRPVTTTTQRPIFGLFQGVRNWLAGAFIGPESQYPQQQQSRRPSLAAVAVRPRPRPATTSTEDPFDDEFSDFVDVAPQKPSSSTVKTVKKPSPSSPNIFSDEFDQDVTVLKERPRSIRPNTNLEEISSTEKPRPRQPKSRRKTTTTPSPFLFDDEEIVDDEPPQQVRGQLVDAAINVTKAFSQFLGAAIQGAASTFQNFLNSGTRNIWQTSGSIG